jgi:hypothetical protein
MTTPAGDDDQAYPKGNGSADCGADRTPHGEGGTGNFVQGKKEDDVAGIGHCEEGVIYIEESVGYWRQLAVMRRQIGGHEPTFLD